MSSATRSTGVGRRAVSGGLGALVDPQTYKNVLYLFLAIPLGFFYHMLFGVGLIAGLVLSVVLVGVVILFGTLLAARVVAGFERQLANVLLDTDLRAYDDLEATDGTRSRLRAFLDAPSTWRAVGFLSLKVPIAIVAVLGLFLLASIASLLAAPLRYPTTAEFGEINGEPVTWAIETAPEAALAGVLGAVGLIVFVHLANGVAYVCARICAALVGEPAAASASDS
ncbi:sensor domain-containing protein [Natronococcus occultus]|uniref:Putative sensor domain-containing protein n=1 Tax=Natronococcus occultus SP4 TaxID=694430 RepID=L0JZ26_9EURY|nr:sensor domain-containing protein [Natronococcus occultus]AGB38011.1 hypothetical protein Natoc_2233 [Natronococcus occultus SP4]